MLVLMVPKFMREMDIYLSSSFHQTPTNGTMSTAALSKSDAPLSWS
ncbi:hypothetical protein FOPG_19348 [Fusarium oxysporum f. sp. conglutinans race 2 54008]|uniref:Uncharacterized protein n=1 Tax=Fusarium oxysporum f. sp. conglutinans race 2 54008 TaxID=1089457 RepID=X0GX36_FUSOX|nr:hypothetical protein FOPG_19348 [Fusarium oxysporum f. sp. conglutinans race 2 54008]